MGEKVRRTKLYRVRRRGALYYEFYSREQYFKHLEGGAEFIETKCLGWFKDPTPTLDQSLSTEILLSRET